MDPDHVFFFETFDVEMPQCLEECRAFSWSGTEDSECGGVVGRGRDQVVKTPKIQGF